MSSPPQPSTLNLRVQPDTLAVLSRGGQDRDTVARVAQHVLCNPVAESQKSCITFLVSAHLEVAFGRYVSAAVCSTTAERWDRANEMQPVLVAVGKKNYRVQREDFWNHRIEGGPSQAAILHTHSLGKC